MFVGENIPDSYTTIKTSIWAIIKKNPEMLKFVPDHLLTKNMYKNAVKKLQFVILHVPDKYMSRESCWYLSANIKICSWLIFTIKMLKKLDNIVFSTDDTDLDDIDWYSYIP